MANKIMAKITAKTTLKKILSQKKRQEILTKHNVPCLSCPMAIFEIGKLKIGEVCKMYELPLGAILKDLNNSKKNK